MGNYLVQFISANEKASTNIVGCDSNRQRERQNEKTNGC